MKVTVFTLLLLVIVIVLNSTFASSNFDGSKSLLCVTSKVNECHPVNGCKEIDPAKIQAPRFLSLDFTKKQIKTSVGIQYSKASKMQRVQVSENNIVVQGIEKALEDLRAGFGWTLTIDTENGHMAITGSNPNESYVLFGVCSLL